MKKARGNISLSFSNICLIFRNNKMLKFYSNQDLILKLVFVGALKSRWNRSHSRVPQKHSLWVTKSLGRWYCSVGFQKIPWLSIPLSYEITHQQLETNTDHLKLQRFPAQEGRFLGFSSHFLYCLLVSWEHIFPRCVGNVFFGGGGTFSLLIRLTQSAQACLVPRTSGAFQAKHEGLRWSCSWNFSNSGGNVRKYKQRQKGMHI